MASQGEGSQKWKRKRMLEARAERMRAAKQARLQETRESSDRDDQETRESSDRDDQHNGARARTIEIRRARALSQILMTRKLNRYSTTGW